MVSVVIPAYNEEKALSHTLRELLCQGGDYEVIVVDGDSTDRTRAIVESSGFIDRASAPRRASCATRVTCHGSCVVRPKAARHR